MATTKNIFISHACDDDKLLSDIKKLFSRMGMAVEDSEPNEAINKEHIVDSSIERKIEWASVFIVLITEGAKKCQWIGLEIEYATKRGKRIIGILAQGVNKECIPNELNEFGDALIVANQEKKIIDAIEGKINWENPVTGEERSPENTMKRYSC